VIWDNTEERKGSKQTKGQGGEGLQGEKKTEIPQENKKKARKQLKEKWGYIGLQTRSKKKGNTKGGHQQSEGGGGKENKGCKKNQKTRKPELGKQPDGKKKLWESQGPERVWEKIEGGKKKIKP